MSFLFHPDAETELYGAIDSYEEAQLSLGLDFATEVNSAIQRVVSLPKAWGSS